jgi:hypothetical protein
LCVVAGHDDGLDLRQADGVIGALGALRKCSLAEGRNWY